MKNATFYLRTKTGWERTDFNRLAPGDVFRIHNRKGAHIARTHAKATGNGSIKTYTLKGRPLGPHRRPLFSKLRQGYGEARP